SRAVKCAGNEALALELAHVAQVHEDDVVSTVPTPGLVQADGGDPRLRLVDQLAETLLQLHLAPPDSPPALLGGERGAAFAVIVGERDVGLRDRLRLVGDARDVAPAHRHIELVVGRAGVDRKSTRLNSSHRTNSYAVFRVK